MGSSLNDAKSKGPTREEKHLGLQSRIADSATTPAHTKFLVLDADLFGDLSEARFGSHAARPIMSGSSASK